MRGQIAGIALFLAGAAFAAEEPGTVGIGLAQLYSDHQPDKPFVSRW